MQIALPVTEALALVAAAKPMPPLVRSIVAEGSTVHAEIDLRLIPDPPMAVRLAAAAAGTVRASLRFTGYAAGVATLEFSAQARGLPAHKLLNLVVGPINSARAERGLPEGMFEVRKGATEPVVAVRVQDLVDAHVAGATLVALDLRDAVVHATVSIGALTIHNR